jgi:hypothetical protein
MDLIHTRRRIAEVVNGNIPIFPDPVVTPHNYSGTAAADTGALTFSHTVAVGTHRCLVVGAGSSQNGLSGATYDGVAMTLLGTLLGEGHSYIWYMVDPPEGAHDVVVSASPVTHVMAGAVDFTGVDHDNPGTYDSNIPVAPDADISFVLGANDYMLSVLNYWSNSGAVTPDGGQTQVFDTSSDGSWRTNCFIKNGTGTVNIGFADLNASFDASMSGMKLNASTLF